MDLFTVSIKDNGVVGVELNGELDEVISLEEFKCLGPLIEKNIYPVVQAISEIINNNLEDGENE